MNETDVLKQNMFAHDHGYIRIMRQEERFDTFMFHVREIRDIVIHYGDAVHKPTGGLTPCIRLHIDLIGGQSVHSGPHHPESGLERVKEMATAFLALRDQSFGLPVSNYEVRTVETDFYLNKPFVYWDLPETSAE